MTAAFRFDPRFLKRLERLALVSRRLGGSLHKGLRQSRSHGSSVEFADFREYLPGDDTRFVDWNAFARLERLFIKLFHEESSLCLHLLLDNSASMGFGAPAKLDAAKRYAAALAYVALARLDSVTVTALAGGADASLAPRRGRQQIHSILEFLTRVGPAGALDLNRSLRRYGSHPARNALAIVISDFLDPDGGAEGLAFLRHRKYEAVMLHLVTPEELDPRFRGDRLLVDAETGAEVDITASARLFRRYLDRLGEHCAGLEGFARRHGLTYARVTTTDPFETVVLDHLRRRRIVK